MPGIDSDKHVAKTLFWIHASYDLSSYILNHWSGVRMGAGGGGGEKGKVWTSCIFYSQLPSLPQWCMPFFSFSVAQYYEMKIFSHIAFLPASVISFPTSMQAFKPAFHQGSILSNAPTPTPSLTNRCLSWNTLYINILTWEPRRLVHTF